MKQRTIIIAASLILFGRTYTQTKRTIKKIADSKEFSDDAYKRAAESKEL